MTAASRSSEPFSSWPPPRGPVADAHQLLRQRANQHRLEAASRGVSMSLELDARLRMVDAYADGAIDELDALISEALAIAAPGDRMRISTLDLDDAVGVRVWIERFGQAIVRFQTRLRTTAPPPSGVQLTSR
jgi:hypothetical protein